MLTSCGGVQTVRSAQRAAHPCIHASKQRGVAAAAFKRVAQQQPARYLQPLHTFQDSTALINALGQEEYYEYEEEVEPAPPEPKYINGKRVLVNLEIDAPNVRVQGPEKEDLGVQSFSTAYAEADRLGLDLVLINSGAEPPLVRLIDFGKYKFELERATKQKQKASKGVDSKELRLRPVTEPHDYNVKLKQAQGFLKKGSRVKLVMTFSGRELRFKDQGKELILKFVEDLAPVSKVDGPLNLKTSTFSVTLAPK